ncbi:MAG: glycosyltransferase [Candidatus Andersenbacteria bacterium]
MASRNQPAHILHLITDLDVGGTEKSLLATLPHIQRPDMSHSVCCIMGKGVIGQQLTERGIPVVYLDYQRWYDVIKVTWRFYNLLRRMKPHILVTYLIHADLFGRIIGTISGVRTIISYKRGSLLQWEFLQAAEWLTKHLVSHYITVSRELKDVLITKLYISPEKITVVRNGIDTTTYEQTLETRKQVRTALRTLPDELVIGMVAKLRRGKGHRELMLALRRVSDAFTAPPLKLFIVGDGDEEEALRAYADELGIADQTVFTGYRSDTPAMLAAVDIFVLPSHYEGMSVALLEAMAAQKTIITSDITANREVVDASCALLVPPGDAAALAEAITRLIADEPLRAELARNAREKCRKNFSIGITSAELLKIFQTYADPEAAG